MAPIYHGIAGKGYHAELKLHGLRPVESLSSLRRCEKNAEAEFMALSIPALTVRLRSPSFECIRLCSAFALSRIEGRTILSLSKDRRGIPRRRVKRKSGGATLSAQPLTRRICGDKLSTEVRDGKTGKKENSERRGFLSHQI
jgi:hypothetical protein